MRFLCLSLLAFSVLFMASGETAAQDLGDLLKNLGKEIEKSVAEQAREIERQAEEQQRALSRTAQVTSPDYGSIPSVIVRTTDGTVYQLSHIRFNADPDLNDIRDRVSKISFFDGRDYVYDLKISYDVGGSGASGWTALLGAAANRTLNESDSSVGRARVYGLRGVSLGGEEWALNLEDVRLTEIEFLRN